MLARLYIDAEFSLTKGSKTNRVSILLLDLRTYLCIPGKIGRVLVLENLRIGIGAGRLITSKKLKRMVD